MKKTAIEKTIDLLGAEALRRLLKDVFGKMSLGMVYKARANGWAPAEWHEIIEIGTNHKIKVRDLKNDMYINKRKIEPAHVRRTARKFAKSIK